MSRTDTELLDALEKHGEGCGLIHDDDGHWYVADAGAQTLIIDGPKPFESTFYIMPEELSRGGKTVREAINNWLDEEE